MFDLDNLLYHGRKIVIGFALLFVIYVNVYAWLFVPFADFDFYWRPDDQLKIQHVPSESLAAPYLQNGDEVLAIDGKPAGRSDVIYTGVKSSYEFTVRRGNETLVFDVPFSTIPTATAISYRLPAGTLALVFWLVGTIILHFAQKGNHIAIRVGYIFVGLSVVIIGVQTELLSVPGAWLSRPLWFIPIVGIAYLGFVPRLNSLSQQTSKLFKWLLIIAGILGIVALLEAALLFPLQTSIQRLIGISTYELALLAGGTAWLVGFTTLFVRSYRMPAASYERQQIIILLFFVGLAILPVTLLTLIPRALFDVVFFPFPFAITLFVLVPAGYFFVIYRRGYLGLDVVFSRTIIFIVLALTMLTIYGSGLTLLRSLFDFGSNSILPATVMLVPILLLTKYTAKPLDNWVYGIFFGPVTRNRSLPEFASALSSKPELTTLKAIMNSLVNDFHFPQAMLILINEDGLLSPVTLVNVAQWQPGQATEFETFHKPLLRSDALAQADHPLFQACEWLELLVPIIVRSDQIGFLAMARPRDGYFNAEQVVFLSRVADMIAVGSEAIYLFEASRKLSLQLLSAQEMERQHLASLLHDRPLQTLTFVNHSIQRVLADPHACRPDVAEKLREQAVNLQEAMGEIRQICVGLFPPVIEQGLELVVEEVAEQFEEKFGLHIELQVDLPDETIGSTHLSTAVYRVLTESLNNVLKHAQTRDVHVSLSRHNACLILEVVDDGIGSSLPSFSVPELIRQQHLGVVGMYEWAGLVNGKLSLEDNQPQGTKVVLEIPLNQYFGKDTHE